MKYQNGFAMSIGAEAVQQQQGTRGQKHAKPYGETDYIKWLKEEVERREKEGDLFGS
jgi:hypothetical protein